MTISEKLEIGIQFHRAGKLVDAAAVYNKIVQHHSARDREYLMAAYLLGDIAFQKGDYGKAEQLARVCIKTNHQDPRCHILLGRILKEKGAIEEAISCFKTAMKLRPDYEQSYFYLGAAYHSQGKLDKAIFFYNKTISLKPDFVPVHHSMGVAYQNMKRFEKAMAFYKKALSLQPDFEPGYVSVGNLYFDMNLHGKALKYYQSALRINPANALTYYFMAQTFEAMGKKNDAKENYKRALDFNGSMEKACAKLISLLQYDCEWKELDRLSEKMDQMTKDAILSGRKPEEGPFLNISRHIDPELNYLVAKMSCPAHDKVGAADIRKRSQAKGTGEKRKVRLGYLSNNYRNHANALLTVDLFNKHDRSCFDIFCYSYGKNDGSVYRKRIESTCDKFVDLKDRSDLDAAQAICQDDVDILIDLVGQTEGSRMQLCSLRPAPVQVRYLGLAGTSGADYYDYIISDKIVTPENQAEYYSEKFVYMPFCYQVNSARSDTAHTHVSRESLGLPEEVFLFCCFNTSYKIDSVIFASWMNILNRVPASVLWLQTHGNAFEKAIRTEANDRGVNSDRIIFSPKLPIEEHLARLGLAELALDTRIVNGAASTSDALWAGVPVLTVQGDHFASRMSSSILSAAGLHDMITTHLKDYEDRAVWFTENRDQLAEISNKLLKTRASMPLFDTSMFVRDMEKSYKIMFENYSKGKPPLQICIYSG